MPAVPSQGRFTLLCLPNAYTMYRLIIFAGLFFAQATALLAQDALIDIDIDRTEWYENPYLWAGVLAFIVILIVVTRRKRA